MTEKQSQLLNDLCRKRHGRDYIGCLDIDEVVLLEFATIMCDSQIEQVQESSFIDYDQGSNGHPYVHFESKNVCKL